MMTPEPSTPPRFPRSPPPSPLFPAAHAGPAAAADDDDDGFYKTVELIAPARARLRAQPRLRTGRPWTGEADVPPPLSSPRPVRRQPSSFFACLSYQ